MSTTVNILGAQQPAQSGTIPMVLELITTTHNGGADLSMFSQYPDEHEICFPPLTGMEFFDTRIVDSVLVVQMRLNTDVGRAIEQTLARRHGVITNLCDGLKFEVERELTDDAWQSVFADVQAKAELSGEGMRASFGSRELWPARKLDGLRTPPEQRLLSYALEVVGGISYEQQQQGALVDLQITGPNGEYLSQPPTRFPFTVMATFTDKLEGQNLQLRRKKPTDVVLESRRADVLDFQGLRRVQEGLREAVRQTVWEKLTAITKRKAADFESDEALRAAVREALELAADVRLRRARALEAAAQLLSEPGRPRAARGLAQAARAVAQALRPDEARELEVVVQDWPPASSSDFLRRAGLSRGEGDFRAAPELRQSSRPAGNSEEALGEAGLSPGMLLVAVQGAREELEEVLRDARLRGMAVTLTFERALTAQEVRERVLELLSQCAGDQEWPASAGHAGQDPAQSLKRLLELQAHVEDLSLRSEALTEVSARALAKALVGNQTLKELNLYGNPQVGDAGAAALAGALEAGCGLRRLGLGACGLGDHGAAAVASAIRAGIVLDELWLFDNTDLGEAGAWALAEALETNNTLKALHLTDSGLAEDSGAALRLRELLESHGGTLYV